MTFERPGDLTSGRVLARSTFFNLLGQGAPVLVALFAIPALIRGLGVDRFGLLNLVWLVIGYFGLFDLGLSRALTHLVAGKLGTQDDPSSEAFTALSIILMLGAVGGLILAASAHWFVYGILNISPALRGEALVSFYLVAASIPIVIGTTGLRGVLEAHQQFVALNMIRIPMGIYNFSAPLFVLLFSKSMAWIVVSLLAGRVIAFLVHLRICVRVMPTLSLNNRFKMSQVKPLLRYGSWMTVTNIALPLIGSLDRLMIGALISMAAVAYYTTPQELVGRAGSISAAIASVLFPAFATSLVQQPERASLLFWKGLKYTFVIMFPIMLLTIVFAREGLTLWLGSSFASQSALTLQIQALAVFVSCFVQIPFALIQGSGRPDLSAKLQVFELVLYLPVLWAFMRAFGIQGAAIAWLLRLIFELFVVVWLVGRYSNIKLVRLTYPIMVFALSLMLLAVAAINIHSRIRLAFLSLELIAFAMIAWRSILDADDRVFFVAILRQPFSIRQ